MYTTRLGIPYHIARQPWAHLQGRLADALNLQAQLKQAHWNVRSRDFSQLPLLFERLGGEVEALVDELSGWITKHENSADRCVATIARESALHSYAPKVRSGDDYLRAVAAFLAQFAKTLRNGLAAVGNLGKQGSADLLTQFSRAADKQLWFVEAHLLREGAR